VFSKTLSLCSSPKWETKFNNNNNNNNKEDHEAESNIKEYEDAWWNLYLSIM
jgi:hypothetical protein